jgi:hypothetical protein
VLNREEWGFRIDQLGRRTIKASRHATMTPRMMKNRSGLVLFEDLAGGGVTCDPMSIGCGIWSDGEQKE